MLKIISTSDLTNLTTGILILTVQMFFEWTLCTGYFTRDNEPDVI
jgi:hypothetical protein